MKTRTKRALKFAAVMCPGAVAAVLLYALLFGPLFAFSPLKFGFDELRLARCSVFYPRGSTPDAAYAKLDELVGEVEKFHRLSFNRRVRVMVCASDSQYRRFSRAGGSDSTIQTGTVIYIRPSIAMTTYPPRIDHQDGKLKLLPPSNSEKRDLPSFLKHELSHAILYQNTTLWKATKIERWVEEGLAIYFGNSAHYYGGKELQSLAIDDKFWFNLTDEDAAPVGIPEDITHYFSYGLYGDFVGFLIKTYGDDKVLTFIRDYIHAPADEEKLFLTTFGTSLPDAVERYRQDLAKPAAAQRHMRPHT
jgi:hypothetical protein